MEPDATATLQLTSTIADMQRFLETCHAGVEPQRDPKSIRRARCLNGGIQLASTFAHASSSISTLYGVIHPPSRGFTGYCGGCQRRKTGRR